MLHRDIIVIGASAGGLETLQSLVADLPLTLPAALVVVVHTAPQSPGLLPSILARAGPLPVSEAVEGMPLAPGRIYVAAPDRHLLVEQGGLRVTRGPKENRFRPAIDPLFRSAAYTYGPRVIGIILSGMLDDGTLGLWAVKQRGGLAIVQEPSEALYAAMPQSALAHVAVDYCVPVTALAALLTQLVGEPLSNTGDAVIDDLLTIENQIAREDNALQSGLLQLGAPSLYTCPECSGVLLQIAQGPLVRYRCHTGHAFTLASLLTEQRESIEQSLWRSVQLLEEHLLLLQQLNQTSPTPPALVLTSPLALQVQATVDQLDRLRSLARQYLDPPVGLPASA